MRKMNILNLNSSSGGGSLGAPFLGPKGRASGTRFKRSEAVGYVKMRRREFNESWRVLASVTGIPSSTLRRWVLEDSKAVVETDREERDYPTFFWDCLKMTAVILLILLVTLILLVGMSVGTCYLFGGPEEAKFMFQFWLSLVPKGSLAGSLI